MGTGLLGAKKKKTGKAARTASSLIDKWQAVRKVSSSRALVDGRPSPCLHQFATVCSAGNGLGGCRRPRSSASKCWTLRVTAL